MKKAFCYVVLTVAAILNVIADDDYRMYDVRNGNPKLIYVDDASGKHTYTFSPAGTLLTQDGEPVNESTTKLTRDKNGYVTRMEVTTPEYIIEASYRYNQGTVCHNFTFINGQAFETVIKLDDEARAKEASTGNYKVKYSNYKYDQEGNWIYRKAKDNRGVSREERRTIEYYRNSITNIDPKWRPLVNGNSFTVKYKYIGGSMQKVTPVSVWFEANGKVLGKWFPDNSYFEIKDGKMLIYSRGKLLNELTLISLDNKGYVEVATKDGIRYYLSPDRPVKMTL